MEFLVTNDLPSEVSGVNSPLTSTSVKPKVTLKTANGITQLRYIYVGVYSRQNYFLIHTWTVLMKAKELCDFNKGEDGLIIHQ